MLKIIVLGKHKKSYIQEGVEDYLKKLKKYTSLEFIVLKDASGNLPVATIQKKEEEILLHHLPANALLILLDERGSEYNSKEFSVILQQVLVQFSNKTICFVIGGSYGFSEELKKKAHLKISLSKLTFSHQLVRLILLEQLYRAFSILKGDSYHHE